ncbi:MAG: biotin/lipoate A/B protein ligase family protein [Candidatus Methanomethylicia archaeon]
MEEWRLIDLGFADPYMAQTFYDAVALAINRGLSPNTIILVRPASPYVCIGYHQELKREVNIEVCKELGLPIIRRMQGGGAVYLDSNQQFYQIIASEQSVYVPHDVSELFKRFLEVTVYVCRRLGLNAEFKPINDVVVNNKKISGNGAGKIGSVVVLVGNILLDVNYEMMAKILKVPSEKFRDKLAKSMRDWITSLKGELGYIPLDKQLKELFIEGYEKVIGLKIRYGSPSSEELKIWRDEILPKHKSNEWLYLYDTEREELERSVRVADGVRIIEVVHKGKKLIRLTAETIGNRILDLVVSGDFFMIPEEAVEELRRKLRGVVIEEGEVKSRINEFINESNAQLLGLDINDLISAVMKLREYSEKYPQPYLEVKD